MLGAVAGGGNARGVGERGGAVGVGDGVNNGGGGPAAPLDAAAVDELCIWLLSNLSGIAMVGLVCRVVSVVLCVEAGLMSSHDITHHSILFSHTNRLWIQQVLVAVITSAFLLGAVAILTPKD